MATQVDLEGQEALKEVEVKELVSESVLFRHTHFFIRVSKDGLEKIHAKKPADAREKLREKVKARPDAEEIPKGAKARESDELVAAALNF